MAIHQRPAWQPEFFPWHLPGCSQLRGLSENAGRVATAIDLLDSFDDLWDALIPEERVDLLHLLIDHIDVDEPKGKLDLHLHDLAAPFPEIQANEKISP